MSHFLKKTIFAISFVILCTVQSFAAEEFIGEKTRRMACNFTQAAFNTTLAMIGNAAISCDITGSSDSQSDSPATASTTSFEGFVINGLGVGLGTALIGPSLKTNVIDPLWANVVNPLWTSVWGEYALLRPCRRTSSIDMDIDYDLLGIDNSCCSCCPKETDHQYVLRGLDDALSSADAGSVADSKCVKYALIDRKEGNYCYYPYVSTKVVGYTYVLLNKDKESIAEISLFRNYADEKSRNKLLKLNKDIPASETREVQDIETLKEQELKKHLVTYSALKPSKIEKKRRLMAGDEQKGDGNKDHVVANIQLVNAPLQDLTGDLFKIFSGNVREWLIKALNLHDKPKAELKVNEAGWFFLLDCGLSTDNISLCIVLNENLLKR